MLVFASPAANLVCEGKLKSKAANVSYVVCPVVEVESEQARVVSKGIFVTNLWLVSNPARVVLNGSFSL